MASDILFGLSIIVATFTGLVYLEIRKLTKKDLEHKVIVQVLDWYGSDDMCDAIKGCWDFRRKYGTDEKGKRLNGETLRSNLVNNYFRIYDTNRKGWKKLHENRRKVLMFYDYLSYVYDKGILHMEFISKYWIPEDFTLMDDMLIPLSAELRKRLYGPKSDYKELLRKRLLKQESEYKELGGKYKNWNKLNKNLIKYYIKHYKGRE